VQCDFQPTAARKAQLLSLNPPSAAERFYPTHCDRNGGSEACLSGRPRVFAPRYLEDGRVVPLVAKVSVGSP